MKAYKDEIEHRSIISSYFIYFFFHPGDKINWYRILVIKFLQSRSPECLK
jgi:hypothetical protein